MFDTCKSLHLSTHFLKSNFLIDLPNRLHLALSGPQWTDADCCWTDFSFYPWWSANCPVAVSLSSYRQRKTETVNGKHKDNDLVSINTWMVMHLSYGVFLQMMQYLTHKFIGLRFFQYSRMVESKLQIHNVMNMRAIQKDKSLWIFFFDLFFYFEWIFRYLRNKNQH